MNKLLCRHKQGLLHSNYYCHIQADLNCIFWFWSSSCDVSPVLSFPSSSYGPVESFPMALHIFFPIPLQGCLTGHLMSTGAAHSAQVDTINTLCNGLLSTILQIDLNQRLLCVTLYQDFGMRNDLKMKYFRISSIVFNMQFLCLVK